MPFEKRSPCEVCGCMVNRTPTLEGGFVPLAFQWASIPYKNSEEEKEQNRKILKSQKTSKIVRM